MQLRAELHYIMCYNQCWNLHVRFGITLSEEAQAEFDQLKDILQDVRAIKFVCDDHVWWNSGYGFYVKNNYKVLVSLDD